MNIFVVVGGLRAPLETRAARLSGEIDIVSSRAVLVRIPAIFVVSVTRAHPALRRVGRLSSPSASSLSDDWHRREMPRRQTARARSAIARTDLTHPFHKVSRVTRRSLFIVVYVDDIRHGRAAPLRRRIKDRLHTPRGLNY